MTAPRVPNESYFHLHLVSDATGETLINVGRAACAQYANVLPIEHVYPLVRSMKQLERVLIDIENNPGIVLYTLVDKEVRERLKERCRELGVPFLSVLAPVVQMFQSYLGGEPQPRVGGQHALDATYFKRIDALNFTVMHDDGHMTDDLELADVVLLGVSRTSKTPTSIYLANRGIKTANIPLVPNVPLPLGLERLKKPLIVGLVASAERIVEIRQNRLLGLNAATPNTAYVDREAVSEELALSRRLCARHGWPLIDVSRRSIEETAAAIIGHLSERRRRAIVET
ncbi:MAG: phosphoenolpyruvate synthase regulatory protein [Rhizobiales bacterium 24-66-13]|nr:MAG: phosphoenolpyruvate synthase regulatory protein [Rhizobiales bacterium 24-66-13]OZB02374.1 MAG: phosphoenolpyruvate synthase regulatory protein [Rhizobiales bacterium 39-66-18]HQS08825.1 pyruvate, water dikinase regulatory protein [Xanthobacteraceae bacterium]